ncbi:MAG: endoribonuclease MazF [Deltaproteobacteria bacterium]|nr:endoribonuclease MazF [Deltaproteobacteria bacterium]
MMSSYIPQRGDVVWINMHPQAGHEQAGRRSAVVLSPRAYNDKVGLALFCPVTNQVKGYPFEVIIPPGLEVTGVILSDQVKSLDWKTRNTEYYDKVPETVVVEILKKLSTLLRFDR